MTVKISTADYQENVQMEPEINTSGLLRNEPSVTKTFLHTK